MSTMYADSLHGLLALAVVVVPLLLAWLLIGREERAMHRRKPDRKAPRNGD